MNGPSEPENFAAVPFAPYIQQLQEFFATHDVHAGSPEDVQHLADRLSQGGTFGDELTSMIRAIVFREGGTFPRSELLRILTQAIGGVRIEDSGAQVQEPVRQLNVFLGEALQAPRLGEAPRRPNRLQEAEAPAKTAGERLSAVESVQETRPFARRDRDLPVTFARGAKSGTSASAEKITTLGQPGSGSEVHPRPGRNRMERIAEPLVPPGGTIPAPPDGTIPAPSTPVAVPPTSVAAPSTGVAAPSRTRPIGAKWGPAWTIAACAVAFAGLAGLLVHHHSSSTAPREAAGTQPITSAMAAPVGPPSTPEVAPSVEPAGTAPAASTQNLPSDARAPEAEQHPARALTRRQRRERERAERTAAAAAMVSRDVVSQPAAKARPQPPPGREGVQLASNAHEPARPAPPGTRPGQPEVHPPIAGAPAASSADASLVNPHTGRRRGSPTVSSGVMSANLVSAPAPVYPKLAGLAHVEGEVVLQAVVSEKGSVIAARVLSGHHLLRGAALNAVRHWQYRPYLLNGRATAVLTVVTVDFGAHHP